MILDLAACSCEAQNHRPVQKGSFSVRFILVCVTVHAGVYLILFVLNSCIFYCNFFLVGFHFPFLKMCKATPIILYKYEIQISTCIFTAQLTMSKTADEFLIVFVPSYRWSFLICYRL